EAPAADRKAALARWHAARRGAAPRHPRLQGHAERQAASGRADRGRCADPRRGLVVRRPKAGKVCRAELQVVSSPAVRPATESPTIAARLKQRGAGAPRIVAAAPEIVDRAPRIVLRVGRATTSDAGLIDALHVVFDYGDAARPTPIEADDQRQFAKIAAADGSIVFVRRDKAAEQGMLDRLAAAGFLQFRIGAPGEARDAKGLRLHALRGRDADKQWQAFVESEIPALEKAGCEIIRDADFGVRIVEPEGEIALGVSDSGEGWFDLDVGIEIDGA